MAKVVDLEIIENKNIQGDIYLLRLRGDTSGITNVGQFADLQLDGHFLRRPLSIHDHDANSVTFLYKVLGRGTDELTKYKPGKIINTILGLGNGFDINKSKKPLLIGGGIGMAPLYELAKEFHRLGIRPTCILGFKNKEEVCGLETYMKYCDLIVTTDDGSFAEKGNPVSYLKEHSLDFDYYYACGPQVMLKFLTQAYQNGEVSLEARMGCGIGACMGCSIQTKNGVKRICKEGPVFEAKELSL